MKNLNQNHNLSKITLIIISPTLVNSGNIIFEAVKSVAIFEKLGTTSHSVEYYHTFIHKIEIRPLYQAFLDIKLLLKVNKNNNNMEIDEALVH